MSTWYSIVYLLLNKVADEKATIGLVFGNEATSVMTISDKKCKKAAALSNTLDYSHVKTLLGNYYRYIVDLDEINELTIDGINRKRVNYFNNSLESTIYFGRPMDIDLDFNKSNLVKLFKYFVDASGLSKKETKSKKSFSDKVIDKFNEDAEVRERATFYFKATQELIPGLITEHTIPLFSENGRYLHAYPINLDKPIHYLERDIYSTREINRGLKKLSDNFSKSHPPLLAYIYKKPTSEWANKLLKDIKSDDENIELFPENKTDELTDKLKNEGYHKVELHTNTN